MSERSLKSSSEIMETAVGASRVSGNVSAYSIDGVSPKIIVSPQSVEELGHVMAAAFDENLAVAPWGGGTRMELGNPIKRLDVVADLSRLNKVVQHNAADMTVTVQAGITMSALRQALAQEGQLLALDPPLPDRATIGGTLAAGISGPLRWQYGSARDLVIGMKVVQADGRITRSGGQVVKNVSGYDMARLHVGGLGTLGIIAEVSFKLTPLPRREATLLAAFNSRERCLSAALGIFNSHVTPLALSSFNESFTHRGVPILSGHPYALAIRLGGRPMTLERMVNDSTSICQQHGASSVEKLDADQAESLWRNLADFGWNDSTRPAMSARIYVTPTQVSTIAGELEYTEGLDAAILSHPGYGTMNVSWFAEDGTLSADAARGILTLCREAVHRAGGSMIIERCPLEVKSHIDVWDDAGEPLKIMRRMKEQYDPRGILNPGRFVGGI
jgi:glycolate oxidase FAD binding subunit